MVDSVVLKMDLIIPLIERPIKNGDIIKVGDQMGRVLNIRVRSTIILTRDDVALIVPNSKLVSEVVTKRVIRISGLEFTSKWEEPMVPTL